MLFSFYMFIRVKGLEAGAGVNDNPVGCQSRAGDRAAARPSPFTRIKQKSTRKSALFVLYVRQGELICRSVHKRVQAHIRIKLFYIKHPRQTFMAKSASHALVFWFITLNPSDKNCLFFFADWLAYSAAFAKQYL